MIDQIELNIQPNEKTIYFVVSQPIPLWCQRVMGFNNPRAQAFIPSNAIHAWSETKENAVGYAEKIKHKVSQRLACVEVPFDLYRQYINDKDIPPTEY